MSSDHTSAPTRQPGPRHEAAEARCPSLCLLVQLWQAALSTLNPNPTDSCPLYLNCATVAALPPRVSRHNSPSAAHFVTRLARTCLPPGTHRCIVVSAERRRPPTPGRPQGARRALCLRCCHSPDTVTAAWDRDAEVRETKPFLPGRSGWRPL